MKIIRIKLWGIKLDIYIVDYKDSLLEEHVFLFLTTFIYLVCARIWHTCRGQETTSTMLVLGDQTKATKFGSK